MVYVGEQQEFAIGFDRALDGFSSTTENLRGRAIQVRSRSLPKDLSAMFPMQGIPAVIMGSPEALGKSAAAWVLTAGHEMFHGFQASQDSIVKSESLQIGPKGDSSWHLAFPFPYRDAEVMRLVHLQGYLAWLAAGSANAEDATYNMGAAIEAARVYRAYLQKLTGDEKAYSYSQHQEWTEGVAAYFEYKLSQRAANDYQPTTAYSSLPEFEKYETVWRNYYQTSPFLAKHAGRAARDRTAFYHLGMGKALALDKVDPNWKKRYFLSGVWLNDILVTAIETRSQ